MNKTQRAVRRHHQQRLKTKRSRYSNAGFACDAVTPVSAGIAYVTPCGCSCWMCGNQRHHHGPNMQERRAKMRFHGGE